MKKTKSKKALVLGVGNILLRDEGLGVRVVEHLNRCFAFPPGVECVDGGTLGVGLLPLLEGFGRVVIVDALSGVAPGKPHRIAAGKTGRGLCTSGAAHGIGVMELLAIAKFQGHAPEVVIIGAAPFDITPGMGLSPAMERMIPELARMATDELKGLGIRAVGKIAGRAKGARAVDSKRASADRGTRAQKKRRAPS